MSYIVPGDIPNNCRECPCGYITEGAFSDECRVLAREWEKDADSVRPNWCPLIEVKTPHGRLIDADAVNRAMDERIEKLNDDRSMYEASCVSTALDMFAPTVIEAERSEE